MVQEGKIGRDSYLLVESLDRLSREQVRVALGRFLALLDAGINIVTLTDPPKVYKHDSTDTLDIMLSVLVMSRAHEESNTKSERVGKAWKAKQDKAREGKPVAKTLPSWLRYEDGQYYEIPARVAAVQRVFQLAIDGYGKGRIATILNAEGIPSFKAGMGKFSGTWGTSSIDKVLTSAAVIGIYQPKSRNKATGRLEPVGVPIEDFYPVIVPPTTFHAARNAVESRRLTKATKQSENFNVFQGVVRCIHCGAALHLTDKGKPPKGGKYLSCANNRKGTCKTPLVRLDHAEHLLPLILARLDSMALVKDSGAKLAKDLAAIDGRIADQQAKLDKAVAAFTLAPSPDVAQIIAGMRASLTELGNQQAVVQGELAAEDAIGFDTFMQRLDLQSMPGRNRANGLLKRLDVLVFACPEGSIVSQEGQLLFGVSYKDGVAGYRDLSPWKHHKASPDAPLHVAAAKALMHATKPHFVPPLQAGALAYRLEADLDEARYEDLPDEGHPAGEY